jgi:hypothetical protein
MRIVNETVINNYRWNKRAGFWWLAIVLILLGIALVALFKALNRPNDTAAAIVWLAVSGAGLFTTLTYLYDGTFEIDKDNEFYPLLEKWERFADAPLHSFPTSEFQVKGQASWARHRLRLLAVNVNGAFREQEKVRREAEENARGGDQISPLLAKYTAERHEEAITLVDQKAKNAKEIFLGFWDLVTEQEGLGILSGPEWQNPETFRKSTELYEPEKYPVT